MTLYRPVLRWKRAEKTALYELDAGDKSELSPLVEVFPDESAESLWESLVSDWGTPPVLIDFGQLASSSEAILEMMKFAEACPNLGLHVVPVTALNRSAAFQTAIEAMTHHTGGGACFRLNAICLHKSSLATEV